MEEKLDITNSLIARGYFRMEIPPVITSATFAKWCYASADHLPDLLNSIAKNDKKNKLPKRRPEQYSAAEYGFRRRNMLIPNPIDQLALVRVIAENWQNIRRHYEKSGISKSKPYILTRDDSPRWATKRTSHKELESERLLAMAGHSHILKTDIGRFFPSVYTHSIAWAIHSKTEAKKRQHDMTLWGNALDQALCRCNEGQTSGIAIGPATSHIVAEILMSSIDEKIQEKMNEMNGRLKGYRHVDDYFLCFDSEENAEAALAEIQQAAAEYELSVNAEKTKIMKSEDYMGDSWQIQLTMMDAQIKARMANIMLTKFASAALTAAGDDSRKAFPKISLILLRHMLPKTTEAKEYRVKEWLMQFAARAFALAKKYPNESVMKYALEILRKLPTNSVNFGDDFNEETWEVYQSILIRIMTAYPYTTDKVAQIFRIYRRRCLQNDTNKRKLSNAVSALIKQHAPLEHHSEVAWALWLAKVVGLTSEDDAAKFLPKVNSSICALLTLDNMKNEVINEEVIDTSPWLDHLSAKGLMGRFWLLAYEAPDWLGDKSYIDDNKFFAKLKEQEVRFYDDGKDNAESDEEDDFDDSAYL